MILGIIGFNFCFFVFRKYGNFFGRCDVSFGQVVSIDKLLCVVFVQSFCYNIFFVVVFFVIIYGVGFDILVNGNVYRC